LKAWRNSCSGCYFAIFEAAKVGGSAYSYGQEQSTRNPVAPVCAEALEKEEDMNRRSVLTKSVLILLAAALLPSSVVAQQKSIKDQLVGTWIFVSAQDVKPDGSKVDPWGPNPKGAAMYDANGRFTFMIMRSDLPKFASNNRAQATADEGKAVAQGMVAYYGTYTVNEADKTVSYRIEGSSYPNLTGGEQKRIITSLTADELRYTNPATTTGTKAEAVWKRAK
jgi:Lipocalin-like domain